VLGEQLWLDEHTFVKTQITGRDDACADSLSSWIQVQWGWFGWTLLGHGTPLLLLLLFWRLHTLWRRLLVFRTLELFTLHLCFIVTATL
jgi:hypothetical protein